MMRNRLLLTLALLCGFAAPSFAQATAGAAFLYGHYTFLDNNGAPLAGGKLCTFAAGSSTPHGTWSDSGLTVLNANPVILDTAGRPWNGVNEINLYLDGTSYKLQLLTAGTTTDCSTGATIWTADNIEDLANVFFNTKQTANTVYAGPTSGGTAIPSFRALVAADIIPSPWTVVTTVSTGTQDNFAPGLSNNTILRCNNATALTIDGFASGVTGQHIYVVSVGAGQVNFAHQAAGSTAANRLINFATLGAAGAASGLTSLAAGIGTAEFIYDGTTSRWRLVSHEQGDWIDFSGVSTVVGWTTFTDEHIRYKLSGRKLDIQWDIRGTSNNVASTFTVPYTSVSTGFAGGAGAAVLGITVDNGAFTATPGQVTMGDNSSIVTLTSTMGGAAWTNAGSKQISGELMVDVQ